MSAILDPTLMTPAIPLAVYRCAPALTPNQEDDEWAYQALLAEYEKDRWDEFPWEDFEE